MRHGPASLLKLLCICLFVFGQAGSLAHGAAHGDAPHEHDGIACDVGVVASEIQAVLPPASTAIIPVSTCQIRPALPQTAPHYAWPPERGPPPRSPPALHS